MNVQDARLAAATWSPATSTSGELTRFRMLIGASIAATIWYFSWLLQPAHFGNPILYSILLLAEGFNVVQALGFWWTCARSHVVLRQKMFNPHALPDVDVFIPVYNEPEEIVEPVIAAAGRLGLRARVCVLDDGQNKALARIAARHGVGYLRRPSNRGAKAGNINDALERTNAPLVAVLDCDHVPDGRFLDATVGYFADHEVGFVQTPQFYANAPENAVARAAWSQQALFFGCISTGKAATGAMFCCGTNVVFRRAALDDVGRFPEESVTEDFELSLRLHARGWKSVYVPQVLARGLGPEDMASYVSQQLRWSRGCISALPAVLRAKLPLQMRLQYLLSASYFLYGWTVLAYMLMPVARILTGAQPVASASSAEFLWHFAPYFLISMATVAKAGTGGYTFEAFALAAANFWISIVSSVRAVLRRPSRFVVTPKQGEGGWQPRVVAPTVAAVVVLVSVAAWGVLTNPTPGILNAAAFASLHAVVLLRGAAPALQWSRKTSSRTAECASEPPYPADSPTVPLPVVAPQRAGAARSGRLGESSGRAGRPRVVPDRVLDEPTIVMPRVGDDRTVQVRRVLHSTSGAPPSGGDGIPNSGTSETSMLSEYASREEINR